jgi:protein-S-isoprenylcysteine O-methyltransferase Ste14
MTPDYFFRTSFVILLSFLTLIRLYFKYRAGLLHEAVFPRTERIHFIISRAILGVPLLIATFLYIFWPDRQAWMQIGLPLVVRALGILIAAVCLILLVWVHRVLGRNFHTSIVIKKEHQLVTKGPYRLIQHPMYVTYLIFFISTFLISENIIIGLCGAGIMLILMTFRLRYEEALLVERFPNDYPHYQKTTPRFIPGMRPGWPRENNGSSRREIELGREEDQTVVEEGHFIPYLKIAYHPK